MIFSKLQNFLLLNLVRLCSIISQCRKIGSLSIMSQSVMHKQKKSCCYLQSQGHSEGSYDQNMTLFTIFSELLIILQSNLVWWYIIISQSVLWKKKGLLHSGSRSWQRVKMLMFVQMISSKPPNILFPNFVLWSIIMSQSIIQKDWFAIFKVKVTARVHMIKIWQFLLYILNCWFFCYQTWFVCTLS